MGVDRSSLSSSGVASSAARTTGDGLAVVRQQPTSPGNHCDQIDDFGSCNLDSIHQGGPIFEGPTCSPSRQERMILSRIFSSGEPGPQLTWTAMISTRLFRFLVSLRKITQHALRSTYSWVPQCVLCYFSQGYKEPEQ